jgi:hypothetical protein
MSPSYCHHSNVDPAHQRGELREETSLPIAQIAQRYGLASRCLITGRTLRALERCREPFFPAQSPWRLIHPTANSLRFLRFDLLECHTNARIFGLLAWAQGHGQPFLEIRNAVSPRAKVQSPRLQFSGVGLVLAEP